MANHSLANPQGFADAQRARRGQYLCGFGCGQYFPTREAGQYHTPCSGMERTYAEMILMSREAGNQEPMEYLNRLKYASGIAEKDWKGPSIYAENLLQILPNNVSGKEISEISVSIWIHSH